MPSVSLLRVTQQMPLWLSLQPIASRGNPSPLQPEKPQLLGSSQEKNPGTSAHASHLRTG
eukprot:1428301-Heterocapsa_arctica.AAC.1